MKEFIGKMRQSVTAKRAITIVMVSLFGLYIFATPYFSDRKPFNYLVYCIFALFAFFVLVHRYLYFDFRIKSISYRTFVPFVFALYSSISTIVFSHEYRFLLTVFLISLSVAFLFLMMEQISNNYLIIEITIWALSLFTILFVFHYRLDIFDLKNIGNTRLASDNYFDNVNAVASYMAGCAILSFYFSLFGNKKYRLVYLITFVGSFFIGVLTGSRAFIVCVVVSVLVTFAIRFKKKPLFLILGLALIIGVIILLFTLPAFATLKQRLIEMFNMITGNAYSTDYSTATRILWQDYATFLGVQHLMFGTGVNGFAVFSGTGTYSHANISELICNAGFIGMLIYYAPLIISVFDCFRKKFEYKNLVIILVAFFLFREFLDVTYNSKFNAFIIALLLYSGMKGAVKPEFLKICGQGSYYCLEI